MIIVLAGKARSGKDTFASFLKENLNKELTVNKFYTCAFANGLKNKLIKDFDLTEEQVFGSLKDVPDLRYPKDRSEGCWAPREFLQEVGQFYRKFKSTYWIDYLMKDVLETDNVIITDARFPLEIDTIKNSYDKVISILISRINRDAMINSNHSSETSLDNYCGYDFIVENNGTLKELQVQTEKICKLIQ